MQQHTLTGRCAPRPHSCSLTSASTTSNQVVACITTVGCCLSKCWSSMTNLAIGWISQSTTANNYWKRHIYIHIYTGMFTCFFNYVEFNDFYQAAHNNKCQDPLVPVYYTYHIPVDKQWGWPWRAHANHRMTVSGCLHTLRLKQNHTWGPAYFILLLPHMPSFTASSKNCGEGLLTIPADK